MTPRRQWHVAALRALGRPLPDALYMRIAHWLYHRRWPDYEHPRTLQEHIQAYALRCRSPALAMLADKVAVRDFIARCVGERHLVPMAGVWRDADAIPFDTLPYPVVLKPAHLSGRTLVIDARDPHREDAWRELARGWLARDHSRVNREWFYAQVPRGVIAEPLLRDDHGEVPADVKAHVIGGRVRYFQVDRGRFGHHTRTLLGPDGSLLAARTTLPRNPAESLPAPRAAELCAFAERLAEPFEFLRVDLYLLGERVLVGELTSTPGAGFGRFYPASFGEDIAAGWQVRPDPAWPAVGATA